MGGHFPLNPMFSQYTTLNFKNIKVGLSPNKKVVFVSTKALQKR